MDILSQLRSVYTTLEALTINGSSNVEKMYGCFFVLTQVIQELETQKKAMLEKQDVEQVLSTE